MKGGYPRDSRIPVVGDRGGRTRGRARARIGRTEWGPRRTRRLDGDVHAARGERGATVSRHQALNRDELLQEGVVGLLRALERYDPALGTPFWGYASWWVRQAMQQLVSEVARPVVLSDRASRQLARLKRVHSDHVQAHRREPTSAQLAAGSGLGTPQVQSLLAASMRPRGLDEPTASRGRRRKLARRPAGRPARRGRLRRRVDARRGR